ncbi:MAG TPA: hypothetical protein VH231_11620 [Solirubrobacteraceae bacterium]|jgi:hypothetical protein|nr:hypothetical protein [Solirubrobacteraceae bacterium]
MEVRTGGGRVLGYIELGDAGGAPVLALDGPGSRALAKAAERALKDLPPKDAAAMERPELLALHRQTTKEALGYPDALRFAARR